MVLWGGTPRLSSPIPQTPDASGWGSISSIPGCPAGPSTSPALLQWCREEEADAPGHPPVRGPASQWRVMPPVVGTAAEGQWGPCALQSCAGMGSSLLVWLPKTCQDKTCFFQTNLLQAHPELPGEQSPAPPSHQRQPHVAAPREPPRGTHWPLTRAPCPAPPASLGFRLGSPGTARGCSPTAPTALQVCRARGRTGLCRQGQAAWLNTAQHSVARYRAGCLPASQPPVQLSRSHICWSHHGRGQRSWEHVVGPHLHQRAAAC